MNDARLQFLRRFLSIYGWLSPEYHVKFLTDLPRVLLPAVALWWLLPSSKETESA